MKSLIAKTWLFLLLLLGIGGWASTTKAAAPIPPNSPNIVTTPTLIEPSLGAIQTRSADGMIMAYVPSGEFLMGSDEADGAALGARIYDGDPAFADYLVINVTWYQAVSYCTWAGARLPQEAEWAFAARGPDSLYYSWGNVFDSPLANYCDASCDIPHPDPNTDDCFADTSPVGNYPVGASWVGAFDMLGNVWEWNWNWHKLYEGHEWPGSAYGPGPYPKECSSNSMPAKSSGNSLSSMSNQRITEGN